MVYLVSDGGFRMTDGGEIISYGYLGLNHLFEPLFFGAGRGTGYSAEEAEFFGLVNLKQLKRKVSMMSFSSQIV